MDIETEIAGLTSRGAVGLRFATDREFQQISREMAQREFCQSQAAGLKTCGDQVRNPSNNPFVFPIFS